MTKRRQWEDLTTLPHLKGEMRERLEARQRHKQVRYLCFRIQTLTDQGKSVRGNVDLPPGFEAFWLGERAEYSVDPRGAKAPPKHGRTVAEMGGWATYAIRWDIDEELRVYERHSSVWQEWNATLTRVVPVLGGDY